MIDKSKAHIKLKEVNFDAQTSSDEGEYLQDLLNKKGHQVDIDGIVGSETKKAIKDFQREKGVDPTGKLDEKTIKLLVE